MVAAKEQFNTREWLEHCVWILDCSIENTALTVTLGTLTVSLGKISFSLGTLRVLSVCIGNTDCPNWNTGRLSGTLCVPLGAPLSVPLGTLTVHLGALLPGNTDCLVGDFPTLHVGGSRLTG